MKRRPVLTLITFLLGLCYVSAYCQTTDSKDVFNKLKTYSSAYITEKAYLHFDKPYYVTGDTIYFKAYVTMGERLDLSQLSGILHVDLIGTDNKISQGIKLQLINGLGWGDFALPDTLPKGNYRIRAYTQWQRNEGNYFEQTIPIGSVHNQRVPESSTARSKAVNANADIQFFTEGGNLINGIRSKIAFKAIGSNGLGVDAKGVVMDNSGREITSFTSTHLGMGYFYLEPEAGKTYKANITYANGTQNLVDLPLADANGIALSINNDSLSKATVSIEAGSAYYNENKRKEYTLLIYSGGFATTVTVKLDSMLTHLDMLKRHLHTGITRVTLFSQANEPLCERLIFVQNFDQLNLNVNSDKPVYAAREKVNIKLNAKTRADSAVLGHFSVAVIDENKVPVDENTETTILTNLLLTSDLKGAVEQPNYYFTSVNDEKLKDLDLVMLTHGYRKFQWKQVMSDSYPPLAWQPEKDLQITGTAKSLFGKPLPKAPVALISFQPKSLTNTTADEKGNFHFNNLLFTDSIKFVLQAVNAKGKNKTRLIYNESKPAPMISSLITTHFSDSEIPVSYLENNEKQQEELSKLGLGKGRILKEVKIRAVKTDDKYETQSLAGAGFADQVMHSKEIEEIQGPLATSLDGRLRGVTFVPISPFEKVPVLCGGGRMLVVVDGAEVPPESINYYTPNDIETIEVLKYASAAVYGMQGGNGVLVITTKRGAGTAAKDIVSVGILPITVQGYYKAREFYSPKYESNVTNPRPDLRSTIYWKPELTTDKVGNASFEYYNSDGAGSYRVVIEGIDEKGNIGRQVYRYKVLPSLAHGQTEKGVSTKLRNYSSTHITEKAYLHFDKPYYATGDTIYFKAYVTMGERLDLSQLSGILRVDLIGTDNKISKSIRLQLVNGLGWGDFALPDSLPKGNYRIRAYTQWQRNEGNYFEQTIPVGSVHNQRVPESSTARSKAVNTKADIEFFAEGGNLINGIRSKIAFKAIGVNGLGIEAKGIVTDNTSKNVGEFSSAHLGMGYFYLSPEDGKTYKAYITFADGTQNSIDLPLANTKGIALSISNDSLPKATVKIEASSAYFKENKGKDYTLLIYSGGFATTVTVKLDSVLLHLVILKRHLHTGITRVTLFSQSNDPLCERLIFVQNFDQLNLALNSDKSIHTAREKVNIKLLAKTRADSAAMGHFSVAVINENKVPVDENAETTILTNLLLTSDLKGTVEQPNYYFTNINDERLKNLDLVMLTHGYRKFEWKQVMSDGNPPLAWQPEKDLQITGIAKNLFGKPLDKAAVALISFQSKFLTNTISDDKGKFLFDHLVFTDSVKFVLQAVNAKGKNKTQLSYNEDKPVPVVNSLLSMPFTSGNIPGIYLENNEKQQEELNKLGLGKGRVLKEVKIEARKSIPKPIPKYGVPDQVISGDKILYGGQLSVRLAGLVHFHQHFNKPVLVVWNGIEMPKDFNIDDINTGSIESIEVITDAIGIDYDNVLIINTTFGLQVKDMIATGILPITVQGYYKAREFYSPKYESHITTPSPDLRSTIYWQPELITDKDGNASFKYYNADGTGTYRIVVEGIDEKGNIGRQIYRYKVE